jgi:hypothetical protein
MWLGLMVRRFVGWLKNKGLSEPTILSGPAKSVLSTI